MSIQKSAFSERMFVYYLTIFGKSRIITKKEGTTCLRQKIKILLMEREMTLTDLSKKLNKSLSTMSDKMKRDNFSEKDLKKIAEVLNYDIIFTDRETGKQI